MRTWRLVKAKHRETAFDGEGASTFGGRWSSPGFRVVYTASTAALATLEILVHLKRRDIIQPLVLFACDFADGLVSSIEMDRLPRHWRLFPAPPELTRLGNDWVDSGASAVLRVPSAIVPTEWNYLLNPAHPDYAAIRIGPPLPFDIDQRLLP